MCMKESNNEKIRVFDHWRSLQSAKNLEEENEEKHLQVWMNRKQ